MSTFRELGEQAKAEIRTHYFSFVNDLPSGVTVSSATATHRPPSGSASTPTVGSITASVVPVQLGVQTVAGDHYLDVLATLSNGDKSLIEGHIVVRR
jgi:hypothetical protein